MALGIPSWLQGLATLSELGGGLGLIVGLLTPVASLGMVCTMAYAIISVHLKAGEPFANPEGGPSWELNALYLIIPLAIIVLRARKSVGRPGSSSAVAARFARGLYSAWVRAIPPAGWYNTRSSPSRNGNSIPPRQHRFRRNRLRGARVWKEDGVYGRPPSSVSC